MVLLGLDGIGTRDATGHFLLLHHSDDVGWVPTLVWWVTLNRLVWLSRFEPGQNWRDGHARPPSCSSDSESAVDDHTSTTTLGYQTRETEEETTMAFVVGVRHYHHPACRAGLSNKKRILFLFSRPQDWIVRSIDRSIGWINGSSKGKGQPAGQPASTVVTNSSRGAQERKVGRRCTVHGGSERDNRNTRPTVTTTANNHNDSTKNKQTITKHNHHHHDNDNETFSLQRQLIVS